MGDLSVATGVTAQDQQSFMRALLADVHALERLLDEGRIESGVWRVGAEQEMFLVDSGMRPTPAATAILADADDGRLTGELALFNLEANLSPQPFSGSCFKALRGELEEVLTRARSLARAHGAEILLAGILPTLKLADLGYDNMTPQTRYFELDRAIRQERGGDFEINIRGVDDLHLVHDNVMLESCNTSLQLHLQVGPDELCTLHNLAQLVTAPLLAAAVNSPTLLGRRLWSETRVALFETSVDSRSSAHRQQGSHPRVFFGDGWLRDSPIEIFRENISRFRPIIRCETPDEPPHDVLRRGELPKLSALGMHSGTVYRWNRICYGVREGKAHLRIENRVLPSGPSVVDEVANAAFFFGMMAGLASCAGDIPRRVRFDDAKDNFFRAARHGLDAQVRWIDGKSHPVAALIREELLPAAREGLAARGVASDDVDYYLGVIDDRVRTERTGAKWIVESLVSMASGSDATAEVRSRALVHAMLDAQAAGMPVSEWPLAEVRPDAEPWRQSFGTVGQVMSTELFSARPDDIVDLAAHLMDWHQVRHVPVEGEAGTLAGLVSHRAVLRVLTQRSVRGEEPLLVRDIMRRDPLTAEPSTPTLSAMQSMRTHGISALPVVERGRLVGIVTERDLMRVATRLLERFLGEPAPAAAPSPPAAADGDAGAPQDVEAGAPQDVEG